MSAPNTQNVGNSNLPLCTVIIPNYNNSKYLKNAVSSAANQKYPHKQIIVVDDKSLDNSVETILSHLDEYGKTGQIDVGDIYEGMVYDVPIAVVTLNENHGPSFARNVAIKLAWEATGIYANLDADDYWLEGKMLKCITPFLRLPGIIGLTYSDYYNMNVKTGLKIANFKEPFSRERLQERCIIHSGAFFSKAALETVYREYQYFYDDTMRTAEDWDLWLRLTDHYMAYHVPELLTVARVHDNNATNTYSKDVWEQNWKKIAEKRKHAGQKS